MQKRFPWFSWISNDLLMPGKISGSNLFNSIVQPWNVWVSKKTECCTPTQVQTTRFQALWPFLVYFYQSIARFLNFGKIKQESISYKQKYLVQDEKEQDRGHLGQSTKSYWVRQTSNSQQTHIHAVFGYGFLASRHWTQWCKSPRNLQMNKHPSRTITSGCNICRPVSPVLPLLKALFSKYFPVAFDHTV